MMYFTLTSLATVGYGDYHPSSVSERMIFSLIMLVGATFYSVLLSNFIQVVLSVMGRGYNKNYDKLESWYGQILKIRFIQGRPDISLDLKQKIGLHFNHYWDKDRTAVLQ